jgi:pyruvate formate lyase activating enzyme
MSEGIIFNVQRFSLHDGPGIRTTVFLKGCPLKCLWCQNPEGISNELAHIKHFKKCIGCRSCFDGCPEGAIRFNSEGPVIDQAKCKRCFVCVDNCPVLALEVAGRRVKAQELVNELLKDRLVFEESGGGITFSGGEPFFQAQFLLALLKLLKTQGIHTAIETCGHTAWQNLEQASGLTDLFLYDLKLIDPADYKIYTGVSGKLILENLKKLVALDCKLEVRMPLIPGVNDDQAHLQKAVDFLFETGIKNVELIPYHNYGEAKYAKVGLNYQLSGLTSMSKDALEKAGLFLESSGIKIRGENNDSAG